MISTEIDALVRVQVAANEPGIAVALLKENRVIHCQGYGLANLEWELPVTPRTVFGLGSLTKPFTSMAIMLLEQQGKLHLDAPIQTYLPDYPATQHEITLMHLLTHTSGIPNFVTHPDFWAKHVAVTTSLDEVVALFKDLPLEFEPGTNYSYCNSGYVLLGRILEKLTGMSYAEAIRQFIFEPLGMRHSHYLSPEAIIPSRAGGYEQTEEGYQHARTITAAVIYAAGALGSTLEDLQIWDAALREGRLLDHATLQRIYRPLELIDGHRENYGLGWGLGQYRHHPYVCHAGGVPGFSAFFGRFPEDDITIIVLSNRAGFDCSGLARKISDLALDLPAPVRSSIPYDPEAQKKMLGTYSSVHGTVQVEAKKQLLYLNGRKSYAFAPMSETSFYCPDDKDMEAHFENPDADGNYTHLRVIQPFFWFTAERKESE
ncbi:MAG TPA: serine hydrolase domain-containing protein [Ktedonobacteraceae bacterium]